MSCFQLQNLVFLVRMSVEEVDLELWLSLTVLLAALLVSFLLRFSQSLLP